MMEKELKNCRRIMDRLFDGLYLVDRNRRIIYWNPAAEDMTGYTAGEVLGKTCFDDILTHVDEEGRNLCKGRCPLQRTMEDGAPRKSLIYLHHKDGHRIPVSVRISAMKNTAGEITGGIELFSDAGNREADRLRIRELEETAQLDHLTRMANRRYLETELENRLQEFRRFRFPFGVIFMDIDHFKKINDTWGHETGDHVLRMVGRTLRSNARPFDLFGRWGGEEFLGIVRNIRGPGLKELADRLLILIRNAYVKTERGKIHCTVSAGATVVLPRDRQRSLIRRADRLLYQSKSSGRDRLTMG